MTLPRNLLRWAGRLTERLAASPLLLATLALSAIVALAALAAGTSPPVLAVSTEPSDARISAIGVSTAIGDLRAPAPSDAPVRVTVSRSGYAPASLDVVPSRVRAAPTRVELQPAPERLFVLAEPGDALISVYRGGTAVLKGVRRAAARLPSGSYRIVARSPERPGSTAERTVFLDRSSRVRMIVDPPRQQARTVGVLEATGRVGGLSFSADGSLLAATIFDGPPDREVFSLATLRRVPDAGTEAMRARGFTPGTVGRSVLDRSTQIRYGIDTTSSAIWAQAGRSRAEQLARSASPPVLIALADRGRAIVVGGSGGRDTNKRRIAAITIVGRDGRVLDRIDSPTCTALAVSPDGRTVAVADTTPGRIRILRLPKRWQSSAEVRLRDRVRARRTRSEAR